MVVEIQPHTPIQDYHRWYWKITRMFILTECHPIFTYVPHGAIERELVQSIYEVDDITREVIGGRDEPLLGILSIVNVIKRMLGQYPFRRPDAPRVPIATYAHRQRRQDEAGTSQTATQPVDVLEDVGTSQPRKSRRTPQMFELDCNLFLGNCLKTPNIMNTCVKLSFFFISKPV